MKYFLNLLPLLILFQSTFAQKNRNDLPTNRETGLVSILDSVKVGAGYPIFWVKSMVDDWANYTTYHNNRVRNIFGYAPNEKEADFGFGSIYEDEIRPGKYFKPGQLNYTKKIHGRKDPTDKTNGSVSFHLNFMVRGNYIVIEFTRFNFMSPKNELAKFEDPKMLSNDGVHFLTNAQKPWPRIKKEYYARLQVIFGSMKEYLSGHYQSYIKH